MPDLSKPLLSEDDIAGLVECFYGRVRDDEILGPIFATKIPNDDGAWDKHRAHIVDFWSSIFLRTKRFKGNPMIKHAALPGLTPDHFTHWLSLFQEAAAQTLPPAQAAAMYQMAERIAKSLQMGMAFNFEKAGLTEHAFSDFGLHSRAKAGALHEPEQSHSPAQRR